MEFQACQLVITEHRRQHHDILAIMLQSIAELPRIDA